MGWWGTGVMEGDEPQDALSIIGRALVSQEMSDKLDAAQDAGDEVAYDKLQEELGAIFKNQDAITTAYNRLEELNQSCVESHILLQAFGVLIMSRGGVMTAEQKAEIRQAFLDDGWAQENNERAMHMDVAVKALDAYDNATPVDFEQRSLMDAFAEAFATGVKEIEANEQKG